MNRFALVLIVAAIISFCAEGSPIHAGEPITLVEQDAGKTIQAASGSTVNVVLNGNPTTGFTWEVAAVDASILRQLGEPSFTPKSHAMGSGGQVTLSFEVVGGGQTLLKLIYHRSFEKDVAPARTFEVSVVAK
jgi:inhibitor of cysteine peptidase